MPNPDNYTPSLESLIQALTERVEDLETGAYEATIKRGLLVVKCQELKNKVKALEESLQMLQEGTDTLKDDNTCTHTGCWKPKINPLYCIEHGS